MKEHPHSIIASCCSRFGISLQAGEAAKIYQAIGLSGIDNPGQILKAGKEITLSRGIAEQSKSEAPHSGWSMKALRKMVRTHLSPLKIDLRNEQIDQIINRTKAAGDFSQGFTIGLAQELYPVQIKEALRKTGQTRFLANMAIQGIFLEARHIDCEDLHPAFEMFATPDQDGTVEVLLREQGLLHRNEWHRKALDNCGVSSSEALLQTLESEQGGDPRSESFDDLVHEEAAKSKVPPATIIQALVEALGVPASKEELTRWSRNLKSRKATRDLEAAKTKLRHRLIGIGIDSVDAFLDKLSSGHDNLDDTILSQSFRHRHHDVAEAISRNATALGPQPSPHFSCSEINALPLNGVLGAKVSGAQGVAERSLMRSGR